MTSFSSELTMYATEAARRHLVNAYRKSGLSQKVFCTQHGVKASTFKNWYYRYPEGSQPDAVETKVPYLAQTLDSSFLFRAMTVQEDADACEIPTVSSPTPKDAPVATQTACLEETRSFSPNIYIDCAAFRIAVPIGFDVATLQGILSIMQALS